jgi:hypothetical protein
LGANASYCGSGRYFDYTLAGCRWLPAYYPGYSPAGVAVSPAGAPTQIAVGYGRSTPNCGPGRYFDYTLGVCQWMPGYRLSSATDTVGVAVPPTALEGVVTGYGSSAPNCGGGRYFDYDLAVCRSVHFRGHRRLVSHIHSRPVEATARTGVTAGYGSSTPHCPCRRLP